MAVFIQRTEIEIEEFRGAKANEVHQEVVQLKSMLTKDFLELGKRLYTIQQEKLYLALDYVSFAQYLATPEVSLSLSTAYTLIDIFKTYLVDYQLPEDRILPIGRTKLERILPVIDRNNYEDWLNKAESLSTTDLTKEVRLAQGKKIFEYKYQIESSLKFKGETMMEKYLEHQSDMYEYICENGEHWMLLPVARTSLKCPQCSKNMSINGVISHKQFNETQKENQPTED